MGKHPANKKNSHPTLGQVARAAGVGTTTVSRVINGGDRVSPETLTKVRQVIEALGYRPNQAARVLKGDRTRTIGLIVPSIADPFFSSCAEAAQAVARANGSLLIVTSTQNELHNEIENVNVLLSHRVDGLIIAAGNSRSRSLRDLLLGLRAPVVAIDRPISDSGISSVLTDNFQGARAAVQHLIEHGRKRIACLTGEGSLYTIQERIRGYRAAIESAGLTPVIDTSIHDFSAARNAIEKLMSSEHPPDAFFTLKNSTTAHSFEVLQQLHIRVPSSIALVGFDDFELASTVRPSITVVQQPVEAIGHSAAELLFKQLFSGRGSTDGIAQRVILKNQLIRRSSCGCAASLRPSGT